MSYIIREAKPGEPSLVVNFYYKLFEKQFDFLPNTEKYFLHAAEEYLEDTESNRLWVAEDAGAIKGSICIIRKNEHEAQLRLFGTDPSMQGQGMGKGLIKIAMDYCEMKQFDHIVLWTIDICKAALHLYEKAGFQKTETMPNNTWAKYEMTEEKWEFWRC